MDVSLLYHTPNPEKVVATAARICYSSWDGRKLNDELSDEQISKLIEIVTFNGHYSTLEHATFTFAASGLSRACTHQLVRHRLASYNQQSQRYVKFDENNLQVVVPASVLNNDKAAAAFNSAMNECKKSYKTLLDAGIPAEDARFVLPNACESNIIITMNARELMHFFKLRCCNRAQWEIRDLAWNMLRLVKEVSPELFKYAGPPCLHGNCPEGKMSCGNPYVEIK